MSWFHDRWERRFLEIRGFDDIAPAAQAPQPPARTKPEKPRRGSRKTASKELTRRNDHVAARGELAGHADTDPIPSPRTSTTPLTGRLVDRWCAASVQAGWPAAGLWWNTAVDQVVDAILDDDDHLTPCAELGRWRAQDGISLAATLNDLEALFFAARLGRPPYATVRAVSLAWADAIAEYQEARGCLDRRTGLATSAHVRARLAELYREAAWAGHSLAETHCLVVVELVQPDNGDLWDDALRMTDVTECMLAVFDAGQTIGLAGTGRAVAIVARSSELPRNVECLRRLLNDWHRFGSTGPSPRVWVETLPPVGENVGRLLNDLAA